MITEILELLTIVLKEIDLTKLNVIICVFIYFRKMARSLNLHCDFKQGFFTCDLPVDTVELVLKVKMRHGKHTLKLDKEKRTEKHRLWERWTNDEDNSPRYMLDLISPSMTSDSVLWLPASEFEYKPKHFRDPRNATPDKENMPLLEPILMSV